MLTSLYINNKKYKGKLKKLCGRLKGDKIKVEIRQAMDIELKCVEYINRSGKVNYKKLDKVIGAQRNRVLCPSDTELPKKLGYKRFESGDFTRRLCTNTAITLLSSLKGASISVGLLDCDASYLALPQYLLKYTDTVVVVTNEYDIYSEVAQDILCELGAPLRLSKTVRSLELCDLIIAPKGLTPDINPKPDAVVLTDKKPQKHMDCSVIYGYDITLSKELEAECPDYLDETYFAGALYTMGRKHELGAVVPQFLKCEDKIHTISSLINLLYKSIAKT